MNGSDHLLESRSRKRDRSELDVPLNGHTNESRKRRRLNASSDSGQYIRGWDRLKEIFLTRPALEELDRRNAKIGKIQSLNGCHHKLSFNAADYIRSSEPRVIKDIQRFARNGGPDLRSIADFPEPDSSTASSPTHSAMSLHRVASGASSSQQSRVTKQKGKGKGRSSSGPYDRNFGQLLTEARICPNNYRYPSGIKPPKAADLDEVRQKLARSRSSLSPSRFTDDQFESFQQANEDAAREMQVRETVFPYIEGKIVDGRCRSGEVSFSNLSPIMPSETVFPKPDVYYGSLPEEIRWSIQEELESFITPTTDGDLPILPNFFAEMKGPDGSTAVASRQTRFNGAYGVRGMMHLQSYGEPSLNFDNKIKALSSVYHNGYIEIYGHYATLDKIGNRPEYHIVQLRSISVKDSPVSFRQGATAYRNARDLAKERRDEAIKQANDASSE